MLALHEHFGSIAILLLPVGPEPPIYRDVPVPVVPRYGIYPLNLAAMLRIPQVFVPSKLLKPFSLDDVRPCLGYQADA
jgi:hypothetical protein